MKKNKRLPLFEDYDKDSTWGFDINVPDRPSQFDNNRPINSIIDNMPSVKAGKMPTDVDEVTAICNYILYGDINKSSQDAEYDEPTFSVNPDGSVNLYGTPLMKKHASMQYDLHIPRTRLPHIPINIEHSELSLMCAGMGLTSMKGLPRTCRGTIELKDNNLTSFSDSKMEKVGYLSLASNRLTSLRGCPEVTGDWFQVSNNPALKDLVGGPTGHFSKYWCTNCGLTTLDGAPPRVYEFYCAGNKLKNLKGTIRRASEFYCQKNELTTLAGDLRLVTMKLDCSMNSISNFNQLQGKLKVNKLVCKDNPVSKTMNMGSWKDVKKVMFRGRWIEIK